MTILQRKRKTKKVGCPAEIRVHYVVRFPEYSVPFEDGVVAKTGSRLCSMKMTAVKTALATENGRLNLQFEEVFYLQLPDVDEHKYHPTEGVAAGMLEKPDPAVVDYLIYMSNFGVRKVTEMRQHIHSFVKKNFGEDAMADVIRRRYNPTDKDIRNYMYKAKARNSSLFDKDNQTIQDIESCNVIRDSDGNDCVTVKSFPARQRSKSYILREKCASQAKQLLDKINLLHDTNCLEEVLSKLHRLNHELQINLPLDSSLGIPVNSPAKKKKNDRRAEPSDPSSNHKYGHPKNKFSGRVGGVIFSVQAHSVCTYCYRLDLTLSASASLHYLLACLCISLRRGLRVCLALQ